MQLLDNILTLNQCVVHIHTIAWLDRPLYLLLKSNSKNTCSANWMRIHWISFWTGSSHPFGHNVDFYLFSPGHRLHLLLDKLEYIKIPGHMKINKFPKFVRRWNKTRARVLRSVTSHVQPKWLEQPGYPVASISSVVCFADTARHFNTWSIKCFTNSKFPVA